jgi:hypothetical protein
MAVWHPIANHTCEARRQRGRGLAIACAQVHDTGPATPRSTAAGTPKNDSVDHLCIMARTDGVTDVAGHRLSTGSALLPTSGVP